MLGDARKKAIGLTRNWMAALDGVRMLMRGKRGVDVNRMGQCNAPSHLLLLVRVCVCVCDWEPM